MIPSSRRIPKDLYKTSGKFYNSLFFILKISPYKALEPTRFSFSVSKKVAQSAVLRNKIRRRGYKVVEKHLSEIKKGYLVFFQGKKGVGEVSFEVLSKDIVELLTKTSVIQLSI